MTSPSTESISVALVGANGMLARMVRERAPEQYDLHLFDLPEFDMTDRALVLETLTRVKPKVIINCAAYSDVDGAENEKDLAILINGTAVGYLVEAALNIGATLVHISSDYVFDGTSIEPYKEYDEARPLSIYGRSKLLGEKYILTSELKKYFIIRASWLYGPGGNNFIEKILRLAAEKEVLGVVDDQIGSPTYTADLADAIFTLLKKVDCPRPKYGLYGVYHFSNNGVCSWYEFACAIIEEARRQDLPISVQKVNPIRTEEYSLQAQRPAYSVFNKSKYITLVGRPVPLWQESLHSYFLCRGKKIRRS